MAVIARFCYRHKYLVAMIWIVSVAGIFVAENVAGSAYSNNFSLPGTESTKALSMLQKSTPAQAGDSDTIVWQVTGATVRDPAIQQRVTAMLEKVAKAPSVTSVTSPYTDRQTDSNA